MPCTRDTHRCETAMSYVHNLAPCCRSHIRSLVLETGKRLDAAGIEWWIDYGTLLGAVRGGGIIPWDKDGDCGFWLNDAERFRSIVTNWTPNPNSPSRSAGLLTVPGGPFYVMEKRPGRLQPVFLDIIARLTGSNVPAVRQELLAAGFTVTKKDRKDWVSVGAFDFSQTNGASPAVLEALRQCGLFNAGNSFKVHLSATNRTPCDFFGWALKDGTVYRERYVTIDRFKGREFPVERLLPLGRIQWEGAIVPCPADPEWFCEHRYGKKWRKPLPGKNNDGAKR